MNDLSETRVINLSRGTSLGEPEPVLGKRGILDYLRTTWNGAYFEPPVDRYSLAKIRHASPYHISALQRKVNLLLEYVDISDESLLSYDAMESFWLDYFIFGDAALQVSAQTRLNRPTRLQHIPAFYLRRLKHPGQFAQLKTYSTKDWFLTEGEGVDRMHEFPSGSVVQIREYDPVQDIYGIPYWLAIVNSILLKESAVLFRRKYYINNAHMGYILYTTLPRASTTAIEAIEHALEDAKGINNFKNLLIHEAGGPADGIKVIPVSEFAAKDEFLNINNISRDDQLAAHRMPPQLLGIVPTNGGGLGSIEQAEAMFYRNEIRPLRRKISAINQFVGRDLLVMQEHKLPKTE